VKVFILLEIAVGDPFIDPINQISDYALFGEVVGLIDAQERQAAEILQLKAVQSIIAE